MQNDNSRTHHGIVRSGAPKHEARQAEIAALSKRSDISKKNEINVNINGTFNISSNNGVFDLKAFAKEVENSVLSALNKNADKKCRQQFGVKMIFCLGEFVLSNTKQKEPMIRELFHNFIGSAS